MIRAPASVAVVDLEEDAAVASSPNSTVSSLSGNKRDLATARGGGDENEAERASCSRGGGSGGSDDEDGGNGDGSRKKLRLSKEQALVLEETFKEHSTLNPVSGIFSNLLLLIAWTFFDWLLSKNCVIFFLELSDWAEAKAGSSKTGESKGKTSGSVVSEPKGKVKKLSLFLGV